MRSDFRDEKYELSYALMPEYQSKGLGSKMVFDFLWNYLRYKPLRCIIKKGNIASEKIAKWYRLKPMREEDGFVYWEGDGQSKYGDDYE